MASLIRFLQNRLTPGGYLGLHLTVGALIIILASWWFAEIAEDLLSPDRMVLIDARVADWLHRHGTPAVTRLALGVTFFGSVGFITVATLGAAAFLSWRRYWYRLLALTLTMAGGSLLNVMLKLLFHRQRPVFDDPILTLSSFSFPSGHAMGSTLFYGLMALFVVIYTRRWRWALLAIFTALGVISLIALSRIYLGVHFLSDVLGAVAAGVAWLAACQTAVEVLRRRRARRT